MITAMMFWWVLIVAVVEGLTEFLPVSSTGHLIVVSWLLGIKANDFWKSFEIAIQLGAIMSVGVLYAKKLWGNVSAWGKLLTAFVPTGIIGFLTYGLVKKYLLENVNLTIMMLGVGGVAIIFMEKWLVNKKPVIDSWEKVSYTRAFGVGVIQAVSIIPGVSRAAATILGAGFLGFSREAAVEFSFLLALPTMAAATGWDLIKTGGAFTTSEWLTLGLGTAIAFVAARIAIVWLLDFVKKHTFEAFGWYRIGLAVVMWLLIKGVL